jgi:hypothetical protein
LADTLDRRAATPITTGQAMAPRSVDTVFMP